MAGPSKRQLAQVRNGARSILRRTAKLDLDLLYLWDCGTITLEQAETVQADRARAAKEVA